MRMDSQVTVIHGHQSCMSGSRRPAMFSSSLSSTLGPWRCLQHSPNLLPQEGVMSLDLFHRTPSSCLLLVVT